MHRITTHILDTSKGKPVAKVKVLLMSCQGMEWETLGEAQTDNDGRAGFDPVKVHDKIEPIFYKIVFFTRQYFADQQIDTFYPWVDISFMLPKGDGHCHIPLLISPYGFTTYRGS